MNRTDPISSKSEKQTLNVTMKVNILQIIKKNGIYNIKEPVAVGHLLKQMGTIQELTSNYCPNHPECHIV